MTTHQHMVTRRGRDLRTANADDHDEPDPCLLSEDVENCDEKPKGIQATSDAGRGLRRLIKISCHGKYFKIKFSRQKS